MYSFVAEMSEQDCKKNLQKLENAEVDGVAVQNAEGNPKIGGKRTQFGGFQLNSKFYSVCLVNVFSFMF